jgi:hypothetical protein
MVKSCPFSLQAMVVIVVPLLFGARLVGARFG